jgi:hypothetical protein
MKGSLAALDAYVRQADREMTRFLEARAFELAPGAKLLVIMPGSDGAWRCGDGIFDVLNDAALDLVTAERLPRRRLENLVLPIYFRTLEEMTAPLTRASSPVKGAFRIDRAETLEVPAPFEEALRRRGDVTAYAQTYTGFVRAFSEPVIAGALVEPGQDQSIIDELYERVRGRIIAAPQRYTMRNIQVAMLLTRES